MVRSTWMGLLALTLASCGSDCPDQTCNCSQGGAGGVAGQGGSGGANTGGQPDGGTGGGQSGGGTGGSATGGAGQGGSGGIGGQGGSGGTEGGTGGGTGGGGTGGGSANCSCSPMQVEFAPAGAYEQVTLALDPVAKTCSLHSGYEPTNETLVFTDYGNPEVQAVFTDPWKPSNAVGATLTWFQSGGGYYQLDFERDVLVSCTLTHDNGTVVELAFTANSPAVSTVSIDSACFQ